VNVIPGLEKAEKPCCKLYVAVCGRDTGTGYVRILLGCKGGDCSGLTGNSFTNICDLTAPNFLHLAAKDSVSVP
jgi:hypothetical protein